MKKVFLFAASLMMAYAANAQSFKTATVKLEKFTTTSVLPKVAQKAPMAKAALADNQRYLGYEMQNEPLAADHGVGLPGYPSNNSAAAALMTKDFLNKYAGCKIVGLRFDLCASIGATNVFVMPIDAQGNINDAVLSKDIASTEFGWNTVMFDHAYTISTTTLQGLLVGFDYAQLGDTQSDGNYTLACFPLALSGTEVNGGCLIYNNLGNGEGWYNMYGSNQGNLMIQLIIEREGGFAAYDITLDQLTPLPYSKAGGKNFVQLVCHNSGTGTIKSASFGVKVDGNEVATFDNGDTEIAGDKQTLSQAIEVPASLAMGGHQIEVYAKSIEGKEPEGDLTDDNLASKFKVYTESFPRQKQLLEHFTSQYCTNCQYGYNILRDLVKKRDDIAWVAIHGDMSGGLDVYTIDESNYILSLLTDGYPSAAFNRSYLDGNYVAQGIGYPDYLKDEAVEYFSQLIDYSNLSYPSFTSLDIHTDYNEATKKLTIKVSGKTVDELEKIFGEGARLTIYLTEDGLLGKQKLPTGTTTPKFAHENVLRKIVSGPLGDNITFNGNSFEVDYNDVEIDETWKAENMSVVAFVSRPMTAGMQNGYYYLASPVNDVWVDNTISVKMGESATSGIANVDANGKDVKEVARYTVDGQRIFAPVKGINIVKLSNGSTKKVLVK